MFNLSEKEIMERWSENESIRVSICCITYKQDLYIAQAIDSFLMQMTTFPFEIIVGEDCGGDDTLTILAAYQARYPNLIKVIASEKNIGANSNFLKILNIAQGDYIAVCEGDDYWVDESKLQKQVSSLEQNIQSDICFTAAKTLDSNGATGESAKHSNNSCIFTLKDVIYGGGGFMPTASLMFRKSIIKKIPDWFLTAPIGDFYIQIISSLKGGAIYLPDMTVVYRVNAIGSWSCDKKYSTENKMLSTLNGLLHCADQLALCGVNKEYIHYIKAIHGTDTAAELLINGYFNQVREVIVQSWIEKKMIGKMQVLIYLLRRAPCIARKIIQSKNGF